MAEPVRPPRILSVAEFVLRLRDVVERGVGLVWVAGEISNCKRAPSGHIYFTLKDAQAQVAAVMWRSAAQRLGFQLADGAEVLAYGRASIYPERGALQLYVDTLEPRGFGALQVAFEQLKAKLQAEGLFAPSRKRPLPRFPRTVGIVTARTGAVIHDMRTVLRQRWPAARVLLRPVPVQGREAAPEIAAAIHELSAIEDVDVLIVGRGGGSLEDLWAFNEEIVARAIAASPVPVVSAVGHEVDFTIADFVADVRAATPTAAAALVVPDRHELLAQVTEAARRLARALVQQTTMTRLHLDRLARALGDPRRALRDRAQHIDELGDRARRALVRRVAWERRDLDDLAHRLARSGPAARLVDLQTRVETVRQRLDRAAHSCTGAARVRLSTTAGRLDLLSPLACLERGYAIVRRDDAAAGVVRDAAALAVGDSVTLRLARGRARARIEDTST